MHRTAGGQATAGDAARATARGGDPVEVVDGLAAAVEAACAGLDLEQVDPAALPGLVRTLERCHRQLSAARSRAIGMLARRRAYDRDGHRSTAAWLAGELHVDPRSAAREARLASNLHRLPRLADAWAAGQLSTRHAHTVAGAIHRAGPDVDRQALESELVAAGARMHPGRLARHARQRRIQDQPADADAREAAAFAARSAHYTPRDDGGATFTLQLTPGDHEIHRTALQARMTSDAADLPPDQRRTWSQRLYDAAMDIARRDLADPDRPTRHGTPVTATVIVPADTLLGVDHRSNQAVDSGDSGGDSGGGQACGQAAFGGFAGPVTATTARRLACNAQLSRVLLAPDGQVTDVGRTQRAATAAQHRALLAIWRGCARCGAPPSFCEAHHIRWWDRDHGRTDLENLLPLCWACHSAVHHTGLRITPHPDGTVTFTTRTGIHHHRAPP